MTPHHPRAGLRRLPLLLVVTLPLALSACGDEPRAEPTSFLLTDLEGGTAAPGSEPLTPTPSATSTGTPTDTPARTPAPTRTPSGAPGPTSSPSSPSTAPGDAVDGEALVALVAAAVGGFETFRVTIGDGTSTPDVAAAVVYGTTEAYDATLATGPDQPPVVFRRVQGTFYAGTAEELEAVEPDDPRLSASGAGVVPAFAAWQPLLDLRAALLGAEDVDASGTTYAYRLDLEALPRPSLLVPDAVTGTAEVTLSLDTDDLPVRLRLEYGVDTLVEVAYAAWGERVQIEVPSTG